jgi:RNA polymerase sigma-70 factor (ECF subfamily)
MMLPGRVREKETLSLSLVEASRYAVEEQHEGLDDDVFDALYRRHHPRLVRLLKRRVGDPALAEDLAQDTLIRAMTNIDSFDRSRPMWPWLKTIATRLAIDDARSRGREVLCNTAEEGTVDLDWSEDGPLVEALDRLTANQRAAVSLRYLEGWKIADAASFLGITRDAFEQLLARARRRLRTEYSQIAESAMGLAFVKRIRLALGRGSRSVRDALGPQTSFGGIASDIVIQLTSAALAMVATTGAVGLQAPVLASGGALHARPTNQSIADSRPHSTSDARSSTRPPSTASGGHDSAPSGAAGTKKLVGDITDPNRNVRQPEDAFITSMAFAPGTDGRSVYASGRTCNIGCGGVLFHSPDGGATWTRVPAEGFAGGTLLLPPGADDDRIFAMGDQGLQISSDRGRTFQLAVAAGGSFATGAAAISPTFGQGDSSILIGAQTLIRYRGETGTLEPFPSAIVGPLHPEFSPEYAIDGRVYVGSVVIDAMSGTATPAVYSCTDSVCTSTLLPGAQKPPTIRFGGPSADTMFAVSSNLVYRSDDAGQTFTEMDGLASSTRFIRDMAARGEHLYVATVPNDGKGLGVLYVSSDGGRHWMKRTLPFGSSRVSKITLSDGRVLVSFDSQKGVACSVDDAKTWTRRCPVR